MGPLGDKTHIAVCIGMQVALCVWLYLIVASVSLSAGLCEHARRHACPWWCTEVKGACVKFGK